MTQTKPQLRRDMKARRAAMSADEVTRASDIIRQHVLELKQLREARSVFAYVSIHNEPDTRNLIHDLLVLGKRVSVPRIGPDGLIQPHLITLLDDLRPGTPGTPGSPDQFNLPVPPSDSPLDTNPGVTLVPGLAFTIAGNRLGMGGGYYDRFLTQHPDTVAIGLCYNWQIIGHLPTETHDQPVNKLVTDARVLSCFG